MLKVTDKKNGTVSEGYQLTSIGIIPLDWDLKPLGMIADEITQTAGTAMYETVSISAGIGFVNQAKKFGKELSGNQYEKYIVLHKGDFSYNKGNSQKYPQGCIYRLTDRETAAVPNVFESFRIKDGVADYFEQLFISGFLNRQLFAKINHGVRDNGLLNLTGEDFYSCKVPFPPVKEQKKIAEILIQYDKIIELCKCKLEKVIKLKKACMDKMFPKQEKTIPEIRFPGFSASWEQRKILDLLIQPVTDGPHETPKLVEEGIPFISVDAIVDNKIDFSRKRGNISDEYDIECCKKYKPQLHDVYLVKSGSTVGKVAIVETTDRFNIWSPLAAMRCGDKTYPYFLYDLLQTDSLQRQVADKASNGTQPNLSMRELEKFSVTVPKYVDEQIKIGDFFRNLDYLITLHQYELEEMKKMKKAFTQQLLTGKMRVKI